MVLIKLFSLRIAVHIYVQLMNDIINQYCNNYLFKDKENLCRASLLSSFDFLVPVGVHLVSLPLLSKKDKID